MYGAQWCGDCRRSAALLKELGVNYDYVNLEETPEATEKVIEINGGAQSIPVIVFADGTHLTEPSDPALRAKLEELGVI
jgi:glutaredoxin